MSISRLHRSKSGFTLVEIMIAGTITVLAASCALGFYVFALRIMYKDTQRLATNTNLRQFLAHVTKKSLDSTEFYLFPDYKSLDGSVNLTTVPTDTSQLVADAYDNYTAEGDCLVLVSRLTTDPDAKIRYIRIYYRVANSPNTQAPMRYYEKDYGISGSSSTIGTLLNAINLSSSPQITLSTELAKSTIGRKQSSSTNRYPVFSTECPEPTPSNASVAINIEIINGTTANNMLSSSSFNYIIAPRI